MNGMNAQRKQTRIFRIPALILAISFISASHALSDKNRLGTIAAWEVLKLETHTDDRNKSPRDVLIINPVSPDKLRSADELILEFPGDTQIATKESFESMKNDHGHWVGTIATQKSEYSVSLTILDGKMAGLIRTPNGSYEIIPRANANTSTVLDVSDVDFPPCANEVENQSLLDYYQWKLHDKQSPHRSASRSVASTSAPLPSRVPIDLLVLYSPEVLAHFDGDKSAVESHAIAAIDVANTAFEKSEMIARFRVVKIALFDVAEESYPGETLNDVLLWLADKKQVRESRNNVGADIVGLLVEDGRGMCGGAQPMTNPDEGFASHAFQATARSCAVGNMTYAHEHGHNMGFEHNPENSARSPSRASFPWSFGHFDDGSFRTIMSLSSECQNGCSRVMHFSNPNVNYDQIPTGITDERDNAMTGDSVAELVAGFRLDRVFIDGFE